MGSTVQNISRVRAVGSTAQNISKGRGYGTVVWVKHFRKK
jgi:hypothetical protein